MVVGPLTLISGPRDWRAAWCRRTRHRRWSPHGFRLWRRSRDAGRATVSIWALIRSEPDPAAPVSLKRFDASGIAFHRRRTVFPGQPVDRRIRTRKQPNPTKTPSAATPATGTPMNCGCLISILCNTSECQSAALRRKTHTGRADQPSPRDRRQSPQRADPMGTNGQHAQQPRDPKDNRGTSPQQLPTDHQAHTITKGTKPQQDQTRRIGDHSGCHSPERACGHAGMRACTAIFRITRQEILESLKNIFGVEFPPARGSRSRAVCDHIKEPKPRRAS